MRGFLEGCHRVESLAGEIYQRLAIDSSYAPEVRDVFLKLSNDERAHARQIGMIMQTPEQELKAISNVSWESIDEAVQLAEEMVRTLDQRRLNEEEALRLAVEMEQQFVKVHISNAMHFFNERIAAFFEELSVQDEAHLNILRECLTWWHGERKQLSGNS